MKNMIDETADDDHDKRATLPNTHWGIYQQIHLNMYYAFHYAFQKKIPFNLHTEDITYGDFDDTVLITDKEVIAIQCKYRINSEQQANLSDFILKAGNGKEIMFYKYFDSVFNNLDSRDTSYCLYTNEKISDELSKYFDSDGKFLDNFLMINNL
jgi:hypothetical protein